MVRVDSTLSAFAAAVCILTGSIVGFSSTQTSDAALAASPTPVVLVSSDGVHFAETLSRGLFDGAEALVPGDRVSSTLWVRNPAPMGASLRVSVRGADVASASFADGVALDAWNSATDTTTTKSFTDLRSCGVLMTAQDIPPGGVVRLDLAVSMSDLDGVTAQGEWARFDLLVSMRDASGGPLPASACEDVGVIVSSSGTGSAPASVHGSRRSAIAFTGGQLPLVGIVAGSLLVGAGGALIAARRRRPADRGE